MEVHESRKVVTILFADLVASTELGERLDPEALRQIVSRYFGEMAAVLEAHGGTVEKFIGDEVMAVFGVPAAHEDDALRAVRASAAMHERLAALNEELEPIWGARLQIRIGINTGEVVAGDPSAGHGFVTGSPVNVAKRLEQAAEPGEILLGDATHHLVRHAVETTPIGPISLRGKPEVETPQRLHEVSAEAEALARNFEGPLVGRGVELARLKTAYAQVAEARRAHLFTLLGAAGIGKSRLAKQLLEEVGGEATTLVGRCLPYGEGITFWPVHQILPDTPLTGTNEQIFWRVKRRLEELGRERPVVVCFEDVHWGEPTFLDLVQYLAGWIRESPVLLLCLGRPDLLERRPDWLAPDSGGEVLTLAPLERDAVLELVQSLDVPGSALEQVVAAAEGNPLFVEQIAALAATGGGGKGVPPSIRALLAARLDALSPEESTLVERAAVVGRDFSLRAVLELVPEELRPGAAAILLGLARKALIRPHSAASEDGFRFRHALIRDAAYDAVPKRLRKRLHVRHAEWLQAHSAEPVIVGYHLEQAVVLQRELGHDDPATVELAVRAGTLLGDAGSRAYRRDDVPAAVVLLERTTALIPPGHASRPPFLVELAGALTKSGRFADAEAAVDEALRAAQAGKDRRTELRATIELQQVRTFTAPSGAAEIARFAAQVIPELEELGDDVGLAKAWRLLSGVHVAACRWEDRASALERALEHARRIPDSPQERSSITAVLAQALYWGPLPAPAAEARCRALLDEAGADPAVRAGVTSSLAGLRAMQGFADEALRMYAESCALHRELGLRFRAAVTAVVGAEIAVLADDPALAEAELRAAYETLTEMGELGARAAIAAAFAELLSTQRLDQEAAELAHVVAAIADPEDVYAQTLRGVVSAKLLARDGSVAEAKVTIRAALDRASQTDFPALRATTLVAAAEVAALDGGEEIARNLLEEAESVYSAKGNVVAAARTRQLAAAPISAFAT
ncbi:MAG TPA: adenylate/guanylate cyclase domain-containing protein [Gaiellaceae bacterium]|nr:adenylate/guanylate cyclase domain-containing protein [Gaiellaceae bacterium]